MGSVSLFSLFALGLDVHEIRIEIDISTGIPALHIVGLGDTAVQESKDRIRSAIINSGFQLPRGKITINLAPASLPKIGSSFDLPIAIGILCASGVLKQELLQESIFIGELGLDGSIRKTRGTFLFAEWACLYNKTLFVAHEALNQVQATSDKACVFGAISLRQLIDVIMNNNHHTLPRAPLCTWDQDNVSSSIDFADVVGHQFAKRGLEIAATGEHHVCMWGSPGTGKSMLAQALQGILPSLSLKEWKEIQRIQSIGQDKPDSETIIARPFRAPHHSISSVALVGGGSIPRPGEISLAHRGILFLDELAEFPRSHIDQLRQPLSNGYISIARAKYAHQLPAQFQLIVATNPCPCGYYGDISFHCTCTETKRLQYVGKISGPILDRIDIHMHIKRQSIKITNQNTSIETTKMIKQRVENARLFQKDRGHASANLTLKNIELFSFHPSVLSYISNYAEQHSVSLRSIVKLLRIARTIADLEQTETVNQIHLEEALSFKTPLS